MPDDIKSTKPIPSFFVPMSEAEPENGKIALLYIDSGRLTRLKNKWKKEDITINDILLSAFGYWTSVFKQEKAEMLIKEMDNQLSLLE